jgi:predicted DNA-binding protein (UPF0278 family)
MDFCIDTNVLFSFQKGINLGESPAEVARTLVNAEKSGEARFFMPPRIVEELYFLIDPDTKQSVDELLTHVTVQSPTTHNQTIGVQVLYDFVDDCLLSTLSCFCRYTSKSGAVSSPLAGC